MEFQLDRKRFLTSLPLTRVFNTIIALFLTQIGFGAGFTVNLIFSQAIGLSMSMLVLIGHLMVKGPSIVGHVILLLITMPGGAAVGSYIGSLITGFPLSDMVGDRPSLFIQERQTVNCHPFFGSLLRAHRRSHPEPGRRRSFHCYR